LRKQEKGKEREKERERENISFRIFYYSHLNLPYPSLNKRGADI